MSLSSRRGPEGMLDYLAFAVTCWQLAACSHVSSRFRAIPSILTAGRTVVFPTKRPEFRGYGAHTCSRLMHGFFATANIAAAALVRIGRLGDPSQVRRVSRRCW